MRSVVVVLPASMWAMIPMLRVRASGNSRMTGPSFAIPLPTSSLLLHAPPPTSLLRQGCLRAACGFDGADVRPQSEFPASRREQGCLSDWADVGAVHPA